ncbi:MAG: 4-hydroxythreonine-4-phosphate dehydrogenase PdxA [Crocinitomicaceae bacterium]|nr:4-hydroxythreonine-4-phosphate dehydrogenase PdxA [Crocinitomicaceae bacterium]|tara:strand:- start:453 stop:1511 length:1059 start_codon:yes stop_codon:yes gene_type:complete
MKKPKKIKIAISGGDINGIGLEVALKTFSDNRIMDTCVPIVYSSAKAATYYKKKLKMNDLHFNFIDSAEQAKSRKINLLNVTDEEVRVTLGESTKEAGKLSFLSLEKATSDLASNAVDVLVTAPINKDNIQSEQFQFNGHTEYLANYANEDNPIMIMVYDNLRVGIVTGHIALKDVASSLTVEGIVKKLEMFNKSLQQDFGIRKPRFAVLGLNPHNGDNGLMGSEEKDIIEPAINKANESEILTFGPYPADGFFGSDLWKKFDGVLAMYHDQGLAPFKALSFDQGVNFTAGIPVVRTSPDHGTAYSIAGKGLANPGSFRNAVYLAIDTYHKRQEFKEMSSNPLQQQRRNKKD